MPAQCEGRLVEENFFRRFGFRRPPAAGRWLGAAVLASIVWAGCSPAIRTVVPFEERPLPALTESREELLVRIAGLEGGIRSLTGTSARYTARGLGMTTGVLAEYRETEGAMLVERPDNIRMRGSAPLGFGTVFDMVSDSQMFQVWLPTRNQFITGETRSVTCSPNAILNLRPQHIMDALFVDVSRYADNPDVVSVLEVVPEGRRSFYVLFFIDRSREPAQLLEKIWVDRLDLTIVRKQLFGMEGVLQTDAAYTEWEETDGQFFPRRIVVERPAEDYSLEIRFDDLRLNDPPVEDAFVLPVPPGAEVIVVETDPEECRN